MDSSFNPNKHLREEFVSNLTGSSMLEISALLTSLPIIVVLRQSFCSYCFDDAVSRSKKSDDAVVVSKDFSSYFMALTLDFISIVIPMILFFTVMAEWTYVCTILSIVLLIICFVAKRQTSSPPSEVKSGPFNRYISSCRVFVMIMTCLCILAVDFTIFPRKYAKTETYGTGLMDLGVGCFVLANAVVSRQARNKSSVSWKIAIQSISPLLVLGFVRFVTTKGVDYQVHVGEYGVHWNFFFTLAVVSIFSCIISVPSKYSGFLASVILIGYQSWLMNGNNLYLLSNERGADVISQNKEGIFSIFGYWGMYLVAAQVGYSLFFGDHALIVRNKKGTMIRVWLLCIFFWLLTLLLDRYLEQVSRRMCNLTYVTWVLATSCQLLGILMLSDYIPGSKFLTLEKAFDQNLLLLFLVANLLTGLVNLSVETLFVSPLSALSILIVYAFTLSAVAGLLSFYEIRLKFR